MKSFVPRSVCLCLLLPTLASATDPQTAAPDPAAQAMIVLPVNTPDSEARELPRLRDSLRQPYADDLEPNKPYRLSAQERHRLREQLRGGAGTASGFVQSQK
ncbi:MAG: hypothetical protein MUF76_05065 [Hydrogenophaga sp.]|jgi:hypothetical protein|nr:hypothetical protein [Hydrogenophaga sp.]